MQDYYKVITQFYKKADKMREFYDQCFKNPHEATEMRFVWDYWNINQQYSLMRTPAYHYFPEELYNDFHQHLVHWGRKNLGCFDVSPPWLSYYVDGCYQNWHADVPHGPWAFVFSLTDWQNKQFQGGETKILKPQVLNFWENFDSSKGLEEPNIIQYIPSEFNQLTLFDPRLPHGVAEVKGTRDPLQARLVVHGWFTEPRPFVDGFSGKDQDMTETLNQSIDQLFADQLIPDISGMMVYRFVVNPSGEIESTHPTMNNLISRNNQWNELSEFNEELAENIKHLKFEKNTSEYEITLPLIFE